MFCLQSGQKWGDNYSVWAKVVEQKLVEFFRGVLFQSCLTRKFGNNLSSDHLETWCQKSGKVTGSTKLPANLVQGLPTWGVGPPRRSQDQSEGSTSLILHMKVSLQILGGTAVCVNKTGWRVWLWLANCWQPGSIVGNVGAIVDKEEEGVEEEKTISLVLLHWFRYFHHLC